LGEIANDIYRIVIRKKALKYHGPAVPERLMGNRRPLEWLVHSMSGRSKMELPAT
jgi:hypothetical protein